MLGKCATIATIDLADRRWQPNVLTTIGLLIAIRNANNVIIYPFVSQNSNRDKTSDLGDIDQNLVLKNKILE